jgi:2-amino-4-hydroxy-6-hydroxymethyldihydropteridine diphosphokinase
LKLARISNKIYAHLNFYGLLINIRKSPAARGCMGYEVFLGLGSNQGLCSNNLKNAIAALTSHKGLKLVRVSKIYQTEPQEFKEQPWFYNQVVLIDVHEPWTPWKLLNLLADIEKQMGRIKRVSKGPRIIDLDILTFGDVIIHEQGLRIPHPLMKKRAFVLVPMLEIRPGFIFPDGESLIDAAGRLSCRVEGLKIYQS